MKLRTFLFFLLISGCHKPSVTPTTLSSISISPLSATGWEKARLEITHIETNDVDRIDFARDETSLPEGPDLDFTLEKGTYRFNLTYFDKDNLEIYVSCEKSKHVSYKVSKPKHTFELSVCRYVSRTSSVVLSPVLIKHP